MSVQPEFYRLPSFQNIADTAPLNGSTMQPCGPAGQPKLPIARGPRDWCGMGTAWADPAHPLVYAPKGYVMRHRLEAAIRERDGRDYYNGYVCFYCGRSAHGIDHVTARLHGGSDGIENLVMCCWPCNEEKSTTPGWLFALRKCWDYEWPDPSAWWAW